MQVVPTRFRTLPGSLIEYNAGDYDLEINPNAYGGEASTTESLSKVPYYCHYTDFGSYQDIQYCFLYGYNGPFQLFGCHCCNPCSCFSCSSVGAHIYDLEHITVRLDSDGNLLKVYYGAHQARDGQWKTKNEISFHGTHPKVYIARGSHATYYRFGCYPRIFCAVNDYTFDNGPIWFPSMPIPIINDAVGIYGKVH